MSANPSHRRATVCRLGLIGLFLLLTLPGRAQDPFRLQEAWLLGRIAAFQDSLKTLPCNVTWLSTSTRRQKFDISFRGDTKGRFSFRRKVTRQGFSWEFLKYKKVRELVALPDPMSGDKLRFTYLKINRVGEEIQTARVRLRMLSGADGEIGPLIEYRYIRDRLILIREVYPNGRTKILDKHLFWP